MEEGRSGEVSRLFLEARNRECDSKWGKEGVMTSASDERVRVQIYFILEDNINQKYHFYLYVMFCLFSPLQFCAILNTFHMTVYELCRVTVDF